jgi:hypothetical protein
LAAAKNMPAYFAAAGQAMAPSTNGISVSVAYADNQTASANFPSPWQGSTNVVFVGGGKTFNAGAIRLDNSSSSPVALDSVTVDFQRPGPTFSLWGRVTIPANGSVILTQTDTFNFATSGYPIVSCGASIPAGDKRVPKVTVTIAGVPTEYFDSAHVLDTGGFDLSCRGNRSLAWRPIGTTGIESPSAQIVIGPDGTISGTNTSNALTAQVTDGANQPLANASVSFKIVSGPSANLLGTASTDSQGNAVFRYSSSLPGSDVLQASLPNAANASLVSNQITANWTGAGACPVSVKPSAGATTLTYLGQPSAESSDQIQAAALLADNTGTALSGRTLQFTLANQSLSSTTGSDGVARVTFAGLSTGSATLTVNFAGDQASQPAKVSVPVTIAPEDTALLYTGAVLLSTETPTSLRFPFSSRQSSERGPSRC